MNARRIRPWFLEITSWRGISLGAEHFYGKLYGPFKGRNSIERFSAEITHPLSEKETRELNKKDDWDSYTPGDQCGRFWNERELIAQGIALFQKVAPARAVLLRGRSSVASPQRPLAGPTTLVKRLQALYLLDEAAEQRGGWERNEKDMRKIQKQWDALIA